MIYAVGHKRVGGAGHAAFETFSPHDFPAPRLLKDQTAADLTARLGTLGSAGGASACSATPNIVHGNELRSIQNRRCGSWVVLAHLTASQLRARSHLDEFAVLYAVNGARELLDPIARSGRIAD